MEIPTAGGTGMGYITLMPQNYFVFTNFRASTNYYNAVNAANVFGVGRRRRPVSCPSFPTTLPFRFSGDKTTRIATYR